MKIACFPSCSNEASLPFNLRNLEVVCACDTSVLATCLFVEQQELRRNREGKAIEKSKKELGESPFRIPFMSFPFLSEYRDKKIEQRKGKASPRHVWVRDIFGCVFLARPLLERVRG